MLEFGLSAQEFGSRYLEQQPYLRKTALADLPMQWRDFDALLHGLEPDESLQLFNNGQVPPQTYVDDSFEMGRHRRRLNKQRFYGLLQSGATLVLNRIENQSLLFKHLCAEVARFVGHQTTSNAYVSFSGNGTFGKHWDTHDVFAIQLIGKKHWKVFAPSLPLPMPNQTSENMRMECPATPAFECVLSAGDMLYIPRGWWHQVTPFDEGSLHLSVGAYLPTLSDYIMWMCSRHLPRHLSARRGLLDAKTSIADLPEVMRALTQALSAPQSLQEFKLDLQARERLAGDFDTALFVDKAAATLQPGSRVKLTSHYAPHPEHTDIAVNGGRLKLDPVSRAIVNLLAGVTSLTLAEIGTRLPQVPAQVIRAAVLDLARYEVIGMERREES